METLLVVAQHRNQYYGKRRTHGCARFGSCSESPPSRDFRGTNCRTFHSGSGLLPTPAKPCTTPVSKRGFSPSPTPKKPSPASANSLSEDDTNKNLKRTTLKKSISVPIPFNIKVDSDKQRSLYTDGLSYSELWAGPAYSNSPPPSSLPMPKFFAPPKRTVSLDLPASASDIHLHPIAKSAPPSPKREHYNSARESFHSSDAIHSATATMTLRRILNLED